MKNKIVDVVFKKFQSYSFIIFLALILGAFFALAQLNNSGKKNTPIPPTTNVDDNPDDEDVGKLLEDEVFKLPLSNDNAQIARNFYNPNGDVEEQLKAIIIVDNYYFVNQGINYTIDNETEFNVLASLSGTVTKVRQDALLGYLVEIEHLFGIKTVYNSLATVNVAIGDKVSQGDILGKSGANNFDKESGVHVHFEVLNGNVKLNPNELIGTKISEFDND